MSAAPDLDRLLELAALRAVEGLPELDERELLGDEAGAELADELEAAAAAVHVALAAPAPMAMPDGLEARLLARATTELTLARRRVITPRADTARRATPAPPRPARTERDGGAVAGIVVSDDDDGSPRPRPSLLGWAGWVLSAAAIALCVVLAGRNAALQESLRLGDPALRRDRLVAEAADAATLDWTPLTHESAQGLAGRVTWSDARNEGYMTFRGLAPNDPKVTQYQLWIFRGTDLGAEPHPIDGGVFDVPASGEVVVPIDAKLAVGRAATFVVTVEPPGGVVVSDRSKLVALAQRAI